MGVLGRARLAASACGGGVVKGPIRKRYTVDWYRAEATRERRCRICLDWTSLVQLIGEVCPGCRRRWLSAVLRPSLAH